MARMEHVVCNLCGADDTELVFKAVDNQFRLGGPFQVVRCRRCSLVYLNPRPTRQDIGSYYPGDEYYSFRPVQGRTLRRRLKGLMWSGLPGYDRGESAPRRWAAQCIARVLSRQIDIVVPFKHNGRILDVACGNGEMISWMREYGWETYGVDISPAACAQARTRGLETYCGELVDARYPEERFDVVTINQGLEHMHDPSSALRECHRVLRPTGLLIVDVPNIECVDVGVYAASWHALQAPTHLYAFSQETLSRMLALAGFEPVEWKYKLALWPFCNGDIVSIKYYRENNGPVLGSLIRLALQAYMLKPVRYAFAKQRYPMYATNLVAYASKMRR